MWQKLFGDVRSVEKDLVDVRRMFRKPAVQVARDTLTHEHFDTHILQRGRVGFMGKEIRAHELHPATGRQKLAQVHPGGSPAGVLVVMRHVVIDHEDAGPPRGAVPGVNDMLGVGEMACVEFLRPFLPEDRLVDDLMLLDALVQAGAVAHALDMADHAARLINHGMTGGAYGKAVVGILVVSGHETIVETAELLPERAAREQAGARDVIDLAAVVVGRQIRCVGTPEVPARRVAPDDATRLLQPAIGKQELRAHYSHRRIRERLGKRIQPAVGDHRVVIQKDEKFAARFVGGSLAVAEKPEVLLATHHADTVHAPFDTRRGIGRSIVGDEHLEAH